MKYIITLVRGGSLMFLPAAGDECARLRSCVNEQLLGDDESTILGRAQADRCVGRVGAFFLRRDNRRCYDG